MNICFVQSSSEISHIKKDLGFVPMVIPLSLESLIYCDLKKINYLDPEKLIKKDFYAKASEECKKSLNNLNLEKINIDFIRNEIKSIIRFKFNQITFLIEIIEGIKKKYKISNIYITNKFSSSQYNLMTVYPGNTFSNIEDIFINLFKEYNLKILKLNEIKKTQHHAKCYSYEISGLRYKTKKKILLSNSGYNFRRLIIYLLKKKYKISFFNEGIPFFKRLVFKIIGIEVIEFKKKDISPTVLDYNLNYDFKYNNLNFSQIIKLQMKNSLNYIQDLKNRFDALNKFFELSNISFVISNSNRSNGGMLIESADRKKIKSLMISHGTIAQGFNRYDEIYKKIIAEGVFSGKASFHAIQSKITKNSLTTHKLKGKPIITGNLVFAENKSHTKHKKFNFLYAVTNKPFPAMQLFGLEMYHEFFNNLKELEKFSKKNNFEIYINLHPGAKSSMQLLKEKFKTLYFTSGRIEKILKNASVTLSYSSTAIEDSIYFKVPVILFDTRSRYKHCESETNPKKENKSIYYINSFQDLEKCVDTIKASKNIKFDDHIFQEDYKINIKKLFSKLIN